MIKIRFPLLVGFAIAATPARAETILYSETFSNGSVETPADLNGSVPDVTTGGNTWSASEWQENGSTGTIATSLGTAPDHSAFLAFNPTAGNIYTLSATMTVPTGGSTTGWVALGFAETNTTTGSFYANNAAPWILYRPDTNVDSFLGLGATNSADAGNWSGSATFSVVLNTEAAAWTVEWFINGGSVRGPVAYGSNPTIGYVGFARENGNNTAIDNFSLTAIGGVAFPAITDIERDGGGNVILTLDGPAAGLTVQRSDDLSGFIDVASTADGNTLTINAANLDPDMDGADFFRVRN